MHPGHLHGLLMIGAAAALLAAAAALPDVLDGIALQYDIYPHVVALGTDRAWTCSGVLVGINTVVTAWHCLDQPLTRLAIGTDPDMSEVLPLDGEAVRAYSADGQALDVAAIVLSRDVTRTPATFASTEEIDGAGELTVVGFGGRSADSRGGGLKRYGRIAMHAPRCDPSEHYAGGCECVPDYVLVAEAGGACRGDSGGGVFVNGRLAGFISCFANNDNDCSRGKNLIVRADMLRAWVRGLVGYR